MAHNIHQRLDGTYQALYVGKPAWHNLGEVITEHVTAKQVYARVFNKRLITTVPAYAKIKGKLVEATDFRFTADEKAGTIFGAVGADYPPISDLVALETLESIVKASRKKAAIVSAFTLGNGARASATLDLTRVMSAKDLAIVGDPSAFEPFLIGDWSHDGKSAIRYMRGVNRVDCNNMLDAANGRADKSGRIVRIIHAGGEQTIAQQLEDAERVLGFAVRDIKLNAKLLNELAKISLPSPDKWFEGFTDMLIPIPETMERPVSRETARTLMVDLWNHSKTLATVPKSPYRAFQVVAEYGDHFRPLRIADGQDRAAAERRFRSITEGPSADMKARAMELIRQEFEIREKVAVAVKRN